jgi:hypothetical protein
MIATFPSKFLWMTATYGYKQIFVKREMQSGCELWVGGSAPWTLLTTYCIQFGGLYLRLKLKWEDIHQTFILPTPWKDVVKVVVIQEII